MLCWRSRHDARLCLRRRGRHAGRRRWVGSGSSPGRGSAASAASARGDKASARGDKASARGDKGRRSDRPRGGEPAPLRGLPEPLGGGLALRDRQADARHRPRTPRRGRQPRAGAGLLRGEVRHLDPALAAQVGLHPPRLGRPLRGSRDRARAGGGRGPPLEPQTAGRPALAARPRGARAHPARDVRDGSLMTSAQWIAIAAIGLPALAIVLWPLVRGRAGRTAASAAAPPDRRLELGEEKASAYRALKELDFDREAGSLSDDDFQALRDRYEGRAADLLSKLDALGGIPAPPAAERATPAHRAWTRSPAAITAGAMALLVLGIALGVGINRYSAPAPTAASPGSSMSMPGMPGPILPGAGRPIP